MSGGEGTSGADAAAVPTIQVVRGNPTAEELAAVIAVVAASGGATTEGDPGDEVHNRWIDRSRGVRAPVHPSRDGWRASGFPLSR